MKNIEALMADGGSITIGPVESFDVVATAADQHNTLAMLVRREGESLNALLKRLDKAIGKAFSHEVFTDEVYGDDD